VTTKPSGDDKTIVRALIADGKTIVEVADDLGWEPQRVVDAWESVVTDEEQHLVGRRSEEVYVAYVTRTNSNIRKLDEAIVELKGSKQGSAIVGAIKARQELFDRIIDRGQELGFVAKKAERREVVLARLDDAALQEMLFSEMNRLRESMRAAGDVRLLEVAAPALPALSGDVVIEARPGVPVVARTPYVSPKPPSEFRAPPIPGRAPVDPGPPTASLGGIVRRKAVAPTGKG